MISFKTFLAEQDFLLEAVDYKSMFNVIIKDEQPLESFIDDEIKWATTVLKKNYRIMWWLKWFRLGILNSFAYQSGEINEKWYPVYQKELDKLGISDSEEHDKTIDAYQLFISPTRRSMFHTQLQHFYDYDLKVLNDYTYDNSMTISEVITALTKIEKEWVSDLEGTIPYSEQPLSTDEEFIQQLELDEDGDDIVTPIETFSDDFYWVHINKNRCDKESKAMGHCGTASYGATLLSLRKLIKKTKNKNLWYWKPAVTFELLDDYKLGQMKGAGNEKPAEKYHPYIIKLLLSKHITSSKGDTSYYIKGIEVSDYRPDSDFQISDLTEQEQDEIYNKRPELMSLKTLYDKFGKTDELCERIKEEWITKFKTFEWADENKNAAIIDVYKGGLGEFLIDYSSKNSDAQWMGETLENGYLENVVISDYEREEVERHIDKNKLIAYLEQEFPEEWEDSDEDAIDFAKENIDGLEDAITQTAYRAAENGAFNELQSYVEKNLRKIEVKDANGYASDVEAYLYENDYNDNIKIAMSFNDILEILTDTKQFGDLNKLSYDIDIDSPYYGFSGFDKSIIKDSMEEEGFGFLI